MYPSGQGDPFTLPEVQSTPAFGSHIHTHTEHPGATLSSSVIRGFPAPGPGPSTSPQDPPVPVAAGTGAGAADSGRGLTGVERGDTTYLHRGARGPC
jgi:hypothetical protein